MRSCNEPSRVSRERSWVAVAIGRPLQRPFVTPGADHAFHVGLQQKLHRRLPNRSQKIAVSRFRQKLGKR